jgi:hypothetical protein
MVSTILKEYNKLQQHILEFESKEGLIDFDDYVDIQEHKQDFLYYDVLEVLNDVFFYKARMDKYDVESIIDAFEKVYVSKLVPLIPNFETLEDSLNDIISNVSIKTYGSVESIVQDTLTNNPILIQVLLWLRIHIMDTIPEFKKISMASIITKYYDL